MILPCAVLCIAAPMRAVQDTSLPATNAVPSATLTRLEEREFGKLDDGTEVRQFTLRNTQG